MSAETDRALAYRTTQQAIQRLRLARENALAGDPNELADLEADWEPLLRWSGWDPTELVADDDDPESAGGVVVN